MKKYFLLLFFSCITVFVFSQEKPKPVKQPVKTTTPKQPSQVNMDKMLEDAMKAEGMSKEEQAEMKKYMKDLMPALQEHNKTVADYPEFSSNRQLVPKKDVIRISNMSKNVLTKTDVSGYSNTLFTKLMTKGDAAEMAIVKKVITQTPKATDIGSVAILAMLQGHPQAALALSIKAVASEPGNLNLQNNMAALLTSYGFPDEAMPLLRKLQNDLPVNSTILNNMGQAWLGLGETDSAKKYFSFAYRANPLHPEATLSGGLIEENTGDPIKAGEQYVDALETSPNPFAEQVKRNNGNNKNLQDLDFEKIKKMIPIYEYFPKNWMPEIPALSNDVKKYNEDHATKKSYADMINDFQKITDDMIQKLNLEVDELINKDKNGDAFVKEMTNETLKGLNFMSMPAVIVLGVLSSYQIKFQEAHLEELKKMLAWKQELQTQKNKEIDAIYKQIADAKEPCENYKSRLDELENDYMRAVNPRFRSYLIQKTEEYREWLNAWCTWNWYVSGNTKNNVLIQDVGFTGYLAELYGAIVDAMETKTEHCNPPVYDIVRKFTAPQVPNFTCPAVVSIPAGPEWQQLVASAKTFNKNPYDIKKTDKPVPNVSVATGSGKMVSQPGINPYFKTANGSITPGGADVEAAMDKGLMNAFRRVNGKKKPTDQQVEDAIDKGLSDEMKRVQERRKQGLIPDDDELVPLPKISDEEELVPLPKIPLDDLSPLDKNLLNKYKLYKELSDKMLTADCNNVKSVKQNLKEQLDRMSKKVRELEAFENMMDEIKRLENEIAGKESDAQKRDALGKQIEAFKKSSDELDQFTEMNEFMKKATQLDREIEAMDEQKSFRQHTQKIMQLVEEMEATPSAIKDIQTNGLQPSISSGLQAPGTFNMPKNLFK